MRLFIIISLFFGFSFNLLAADDHFHINLAYYAQYKKESKNFYKQVLEDTVSSVHGRLNGKNYGINKRDKIALGDVGSHRLGHLEILKNGNVEMGELEETTRFKTVTLKNNSGFEINYKEIKNSMRPEMQAILERYGISKEEVAKASKKGNVVLSVSDMRCRYRDNETISCYYNGYVSYNK